MRRKVLSTILGITTVVAMAMAMVGCGDDSGSGPAAQVVSGTASNGAAFSGSVVLKDAKGKQLSMNTTTGVFSFDVNKLTAPYILKAGTLYSIASGAGTTNINPFSHVIAKSAAGSSTNLDTVFGNVSSNRAALTNISTKQPQAVTNFNVAMNQKDASSMSIYTKYGMTSPPDFLHGKITIDQGVDKLFADISVSVTGSTVTVTNKPGATLMSGNYSVSGNTVSYNFTCNYTNIGGLPGIPVNPPVVSKPFPIGTWKGPHNIIITVNAFVDTIGYNNYYSGSVSYPAFNGGIVTVSGSIVDAGGGINYLQNNALVVFVQSVNGTSVTNLSFSGDGTIDYNMKPPITSLSGQLITVSTIPGNSFTERATFVKQ